MSWDNNNLACILIFPPWQRQGLGQVLMAASYFLGRQEGRFGGPERPLSALGRKAYIAYWSVEIARFFLSSGVKKTVSVKEISDATWILPDDIVSALREMDVFESRKTASGSALVYKSKVKAWIQKHGVSEQPIVDAAAFLVESETSSAGAEESVEDEEEMQD